MMERGQVFHGLTAVERVDVRNTNAYWKFLCACGNEHICSANSVKTGQTKSCGCRRRAVSALLNRTHGDAGKGGSLLYGVWKTMRSRCLNPGNKQYVDYGGRGIDVCQEWKGSYESFKSWAMASGYQPGLSIDRVDNDSGYSPINCRWATAKQQAMNRRPPKLRAVKLERGMSPAHRWEG